MGIPITGEKLVDDRPREREGEAYRDIIKDPYQVPRNRPNKRRARPWRLIFQSSEGNQRLGAGGGEYQSKTKQRRESDSRLDEDQVSMTHGCNSTELRRIYAPSS
jgi:hypothetical protein